MISVEELYQRFTWLSLDVVFGAMGGLLFFSKLLRVPLPWTIYALLGMAVWVIYTFDHLMDSRKLSKGTHMDRHAFHQKHALALWFLLIINSVIGLYGAYVTFGIGMELLVAAVLGGMILLLMLLIRMLPISFHWLKEANTAIFYVLGIALLPFLRFSFEDWEWQIGLLMAGYIGLAYLNLIMLSWLDSGKDQASGFGSLLSVLSKEKVGSLIRRLAFFLIAAFLLCLVFLPSYYRVFASLLLLMALIHYLTFYDKKLTASQIRFRMEATFFIPWLLLFW